MTFGFRMSMDPNSLDPNSLDIVRDDKQIGFLQKHSEREPRIVLHEAGEHLTRRELEQCMEKFAEFIGK